MTREEYINLRNSKRDLAQFLYSYYTMNGGTFTPPQFGAALTWYLTEINPDDLLRSLDIKHNVNAIVNLKTQKVERWY